MLPRRAWPRGEAGRTLRIDVQIFGKGAREASLRYHGNPGSESVTLLPKLAMCDAEGISAAERRRSRSDWLNTTARSPQFDSEIREAMDPYCGRHANLETIHK